MQLSFTLGSKITFLHAPKKQTNKQKTKTNKKNLLLKKKEA